MPKNEFVVAQVDVKSLSQLGQLQSITYHHFSDQFYFYYYFLHPLPFALIFNKVYKSSASTFAMNDQLKKVQSKNEGMVRGQLCWLS